MRRFLHRPITLLVMAALLTPSITADPVVCKVVSPSLMNQQALETPVLTFFQNSFQRSASASLAGEARLPKTARAIPIIYHVFGGREFRLRELTTLLPGLNFPATNNLLFRLRDIGLLNYRKARLSGRTFGQKRVFHSLHAGIVALSPSDVDRLVTYVFGTEPVEAVEGDDDPVRALAAPWWKSRQSTLRARLKHRTPKGQEEAPLEDLHEPPDLEDVGMTIRPTVRSWTDHLAEGDRYATPRITLTAEQAWNLPFDRTPRPPAPTPTASIRRAVQTPEPDSISAPDAPLPGTPVDRREIDLQNGDLIAWRRMPGWPVEEGTVTGVERFPTGPSIIRVLVTRANGLEDYHFFYDDLAKVTRLANALSATKRQAMHFLQNSGVIDLLRSPLPLSTVDHLIDLRLGKRLADPAVWEDSRVRAAMEVKELTAGGLADPTERSRVLQRVRSATKEEWKRWFSRAGIARQWENVYAQRHTLPPSYDFFVSFPGIQRSEWIALYEAIQDDPIPDNNEPSETTRRPRGPRRPRRPEPEELASLPDYLKHPSLLEWPWQFIYGMNHVARHLVKLKDATIRFSYDRDQRSFHLDTIHDYGVTVLPFGLKLDVLRSHDWEFYLTFRSISPDGKQKTFDFVVKHLVEFPFQLIRWLPGQNQLDFTLTEELKQALAATFGRRFWVHVSPQPWDLWDWKTGVGDIRIRLLSESEHAALHDGTLKEIRTAPRDFLERGA